MDFDVALPELGTEALQQLDLLVGQARGGVSAYGPVRAPLAADGRLDSVSGGREPLPARAVIALSAPVANHFQRPCNVAASVL